MADGTTSGNNGMLYFIVGALCIVVAGGAFFMLGGTLPGQKESKTEIKIELPKVDKKWPMHTLRVLAVAATTSLTFGKSAPN